MEKKLKEGSISIGITIFAAMFILLTVFSYETIVMFLIKSKMDSQLANLSSRIAITTLDGSRLSSNYIYIDGVVAEREGVRLVEEEFDSSELIEISEVNTEVSNNKVTLAVKGNIANKFVFYKDMEVQSSGATRARFIRRLSADDIEYMTTKELHDNIAFEVM